MIELLDEAYVNTWVLAKDLKKMGEATSNEAFAKFCALLQEHYTYPVDSVLISSELEVLGQMDSRESTRAGPGKYGKMLREALVTSSEER